MTGLGCLRAEDTGVTTASTTTTRTTITSTARDTIPGVRIPSTREVEEQPRPPGCLCGARVVLALVGDGFPGMIGA